MEEGRGEGGREWGGEGERGGERHWSSTNHLGNLRQWALSELQHTNGNKLAEARATSSILPLLPYKLQSKVLV